jgi:hypothetical protein
MRRTGMRPIDCHRQFDKIPDVGREREMVAGDAGRCSGASPDGRIEVRRFDVKASSRLLF